ncbi:BTAD domain-containing putative transcriptional regulator [Indiicoccus explosivorum]|uniref:BTAD domain-containing putative transcriptional regulator n=1 Tax=Indiicoccus explosivorum TaxID=1917864 RepID=UPI000B44D999|nr:BTAD domain-containing putative transcriptional regulator [Indiicoccus explosivorum]
MNPPLLLSRLSAPMPASAYMPRQGITRKLKRAAQTRLFLFHAGAGYGKSSFAARYVKEEKLNCAWYTVSEEDDDLLPFLNYLCESIRQQDEKFRVSFSQQDTADLPRVAAILSNALHGIRTPLVVAIDDFHLVDHVFSINFVLEKIIRHAPAHIRFFILSRSKPRWSILLKMKAAAHYIEVTEEDLRFTGEETDVFFDDYFDKKLSPEDIKEIMDLTEGWAIAVQLMAIQHTDSPKPLEQTVKPALQDLFSYLSEEVFSRHGPKEQHWLLSLSIFSTFSHSFIRDYFGPEAGKFFASSATSNIFLQSLATSDAFRFHALFRKFLENKWQALDFDGYQTARIAASRYFLEQGDCVQAIHQALQSSDDSCLGETLVSAGGRLIEQGQFDLVLECLKSLAGSRGDAGPALLLLEGEAYRYLAYYEKSRQAYMACLAAAADSGDSRLASRAHAGIAHIYLDTIQPGLADPHLKEAIAWADRNGSVHEQEMNSLKRQFAENLVNLGKAREAADWIGQEQLPEQVLKKGNLDARLLIRTGRLQEALILLEDRNQEESPVPDSHRESEALLSLVYAMMGRADEAARSAALAMERGAKEKSEFVEAVGWMRRGHAESLFSIFPDDHPDTWYRKAVNEMERLRVSRAKAEPFMGLAILKARQGDISEAMILGNKGLSETERVQDSWLSAYIRVGLAIIADEAGQHRRVLAEAGTALAAFQECGDAFGEAAARYWRMSATHALGELPEFSREAEELAEWIMAHGFQFFITRRTLYGPADIERMKPLWQSALLQNPESAALSALCESCGIRRDAAYPGYRLLIRLLGPFSVSLGGQAAEPVKWQRDKAKDIFIYLFLNRERYVPKEELLDKLFCGNPAQADRNFKVALNALLNALEPDRPSRRDAFFITRHQSMYRFNPEAGWSCDLTEFTAVMDQGMQEKDPLAAHSLLLRAEKLYRGTFFCEREPEEWYRFERERYEQQYLLVLERLAQLTTRLQRYDETIHWAEKLLRTDHTWEEAYRLLMYAYYQKNSRPQAIRWYERCTDMLDREFGIEPMETTDKMYEIIIRYS